MQNQAPTLKKICLFKIKKNVKNIKIFFSNIIKSNDIKTCQPDSLPSLSFELNCVGANPKWIIQFNGSKYNLNER